MTPSKEQTFKVTCCHADCGKPFHVRFPLADPAAAAASQPRVVECPYCSREVVIIPPPLDTPPDILIRGLKSLPPGS